MHINQQNRKDEEIHLPYSYSSVIDELYRRYAPKLFAYVCQLISSLDDAEDMLLEVFIVALEHAQKLETMVEDEQRAWLWTIARNKVIDYHRRTHRSRLIPLEHIAETMADEWIPEEIALRGEEHDYLRTSLRQLSTLQQEVLQLRFAGGLSCADIAAVMHKREGAIRTMLSRALNTLRSIYRQ